MFKFLEKLKIDILVVDGVMGIFFYIYGLDICYEFYNVIYLEKVLVIY